MKLSPTTLQLMRSSAGAVIITVGMPIAVNAQSTSVKHLQATTLEGNSFAETLSSKALPDDTKKENDTKKEEDQKKEDPRICLGCGLG